MTIGQELNMSDMGDSCFITLTEATKRIPRFNGKRVHPSTIYRWIVNGCRGVRLDHWRIGRKIVTTEAALNKFFCELTQVDTDDQPTTIAVRQRKKRRRSNSGARQREIESANDVLKRAGILVDTQVQPSFGGIQ